MNKIAASLIIIALIVSLAAIMTVTTYASEPGEGQPTAEKAKPNNIFQKLGEVIQGGCDMYGAPLVKTGVFQPMADGIKGIASGHVRETGTASK